MSTSDTRQAKATGRESRTAANAAIGSARLPFMDFYRSDLFWSPWRAMSGFLLQSQHRAVEMLEINRKLADEMRGIIRHEQDVMDDTVARMLQRLSDGQDVPADAVARSWTELSEAALKGLRECGEAMSEAQKKSLEIVREQAGAAAKAAASPTAEREAA